MYFGSEKRAEPLKASKHVNRQNSRYAHVQSKVGLSGLKPAAAAAAAAAAKENAGPLPDAAHAAPHTPGRAAGLQARRPTLRSATPPRRAVQQPPPQAATTPARLTPGRPHTGPLPPPPSPAPPAADVAAAAAAGTTPASVLKHPTVELSYGPRPRYPNNLTRGRRPGPLEVRTGSRPATPARSAIPSALPAAAAAARDEDDDDDGVSLAISPDSQAATPSRVVAGPSGPSAAALPYASAYGIMPTPEGLRLAAAPAAPQRTPVAAAATTVAAAAAALGVCATPARLLLPAFEEGAATPCNSPAADVAGGVPAAAEPQQAADAVEDDGYQSMPDEEEGVDVEVAAAEAPAAEEAEAEVDAVAVDEIAAAESAKAEAEAKAAADLVAAEEAAAAAAAEAAEAEAAAAAAATTLPPLPPLPPLRLSAASSDGDMVSAASASVSASPPRAAEETETVAEAAPCPPSPFATLVSGATRVLGGPWWPAGGAEAMEVEEEDAEALAIEQACAANEEPVESLPIPDYVPVFDDYTDQSQGPAGATPPATPVTSKQKKKTTKKASSKKAAKAAAKAAAKRKREESSTSSESSSEDEEVPPAKKAKVDVEARMKVVNKMSYKELQAECKRLSLKAVGKKAVLLEKIEAHLQAE